MARTRRAHALCGMIGLAAMATISLGITREATFDGGGDGTSWADANNWDPDIVPKNVNGVEFEVLIPAPFSVIYRAQDTYAGGMLGETKLLSLTLGHQTTLTLDSDRSLPGSMEIAVVDIRGFLYSYGGVPLSSPWSFTYSSKDHWLDRSGSPENNWYLMTADGEGSAIEFPGIDTFDGGSSSTGTDYDQQWVRAMNGGTIDLSGVGTIVTPQEYRDTLRFVVTGADSTMNLSSLTTIEGADDGRQGRGHFEASEGATLSLPALKTIQNTSFVVDAGSTITGTVPGATYSSKGIWFDHSGSPKNDWELMTADGAGATIALRGITMFDGGTLSVGTDYDQQWVRAMNGGAIDLFGLETIITPQEYRDTLRFVVTGADSTMNLSSLTTIEGADDGRQGRGHIEASEGATLSLPALETIQNTFFVVDAGSTITGTVPGATYSSKGIWFDHSGSPENNWYLMTADGEGATISLRGITTFDGGTLSVGTDYDQQWVRAMNGGTIDLSGLETIITPQEYRDTLRFVATGPDSTIVLTSLRAIEGMDDGRRGHGHIEASEGATLSLPALETIQNTFFIVDAGSTITGTAPGATYSSKGIWFDHSGSPENNWELMTADGEGATIALAGIQALDAGFSSVGGDYDKHYVRAMNGGTVDLSGTRTTRAPEASRDGLYLQITGANSILRYGNLDVQSGHRGELTVSDGGHVDITDAMVTGRLRAVWGAATSLGASGNLRYTVTDEAFFTIRNADVALDGDGSGSGQIVEIGGADMATAWSQLEDDNFAMGTLTIGEPEQSTTIRLMDIANNGNRGGTFEALYLNPDGSLEGNGLVIEGDSTVVLNGLNVYAWEWEAANGLNAHESEAATGQLVHLNSLFDQFPPGTNEIRYSNGWLRLEELNASAGDVNFDGDINAGDIDMMIDAVAGSSLHEFFNLDGDGDACDVADLHALFEQLGTCWGDININGSVDDDDLSLLLANWSKLDRTWSIGNFDHEGGVNDDDLSILLANWGPVDGCPIAEPAGGGTIPEPTTLSLLVLSALTLLRHRRRN